MSFLSAGCHLRCFLQLEKRERKGYFLSEKLRIRWKPESVAVSFPLIAVGKQLPKIPP